MQHDDDRCPGARVGVSAVDRELTRHQEVDTQEMLARKQLINQFRAIRAMSKSSLDSRPCNLPQSAYIVHRIIYHTDLQTCTDVTRYSRHTCYIYHYHVRTS